MTSFKNVIRTAGVLMVLAGAISVQAEQRPGANLRGRGTPDRRIPGTPLTVRECRDRFELGTCPPGPYISIDVPTSRRNELGGVRLLVEPASATVYVNGTYVGRVSDFTKPSQRLDLIPGPHRIEMRAPGYESLDFETRIYGGQTTPFRGTLRRK